MKLIFFIMTCLLMHTYGATYAQHVTISERNATLERVVKQMRQQTGYDFLLDKDILQQHRSINVELKNVGLTQALQSIVKGRNLSFSIEGKSVVITSTHDASSKQVSLNAEKTAKRKPPEEASDLFSDSNNPIDITGKVVDENGRPLPDASISVIGGTHSTRTNTNGEFTLKDVDEKATLLISYVGFEPRRVSASSNIGQIKMQKVVGVLEEVQVINTGYQTISKERSAGSYAKPNMTILENRTGSMNILQRLDGLVAGLTVNNSPGASQNPFLIRGLSTIGVRNKNGGPNDPAYIGTNRNPLYVVDGIPIDDVSSINPQDVADVTVLKDATAASIWGARASNGVIVITTKKGTPDGKLKITYDAFINFQGKPDLAYFKTLNSPEFIQAAIETFDPEIYPWETVFPYTSGGSGIAPHQRIQYDLSRGLISPAMAKASLDSLSALDNRSQIKDLAYRNASLMNHTLSMSKGGDIYSFYGSGAYTGLVSNYPGAKDNTYKLNLRQDVQIGKFMQVNLISDLTYGVNSSKRNVMADYNFYPYQLLQDHNGVNLSIPYMGSLSEEVRADFEQRSRINLNYSPLEEVNYGYNRGSNFLSRNVLNTSIKLWDGLKFEGTYGFTKGTSKTEEYDDAKSYQVRNELVQFTVAPTAQSTPIYYLPTSGGKYTISNQHRQSWTVRNLLSYTKNWNEDEHQLTALAGQEVQEALINTNGSTVRGYNELLQTYGAIDYATLGITGVGNPVMPNFGNRSLLSNDNFLQSERLTRFISYYANLAYTYKHRYALNGSFRVDRSNLFGLDKSAQNRPVWSIGGKWILSSESFMADTKWLDNLALRATYGLTGNSPDPGIAASQDILRAVQNGFLPNRTGVVIATPSNSKLTWESTRNINLGVDFATFNNRISGTLDLYKKSTTDMLGVLPTNAFSGYSSIVGNLGDMVNKGIELNLNTLNISKGKFRWSTVVNLAYNKNMVTKLNDESAVFSSMNRIWQNYVEGFPAFALFAYNFAGLNELGDPRIRLADGTVTTERDAAAADDVSFKGTFQPVWSGGLSNIISYNGLSLSANAIFNLGHVMRKDVNTVYTYRLYHSDALRAGLTSGNLHSDFANRWKQPGDELLTSIPSYVSNSSLSFTRRDVGYYTYGDLNVVSASYIKLRDITLAYSLPSSLLERLHTQQITLRMQLSNLMLWKANKDDIDPEFIDAASGIRSMRFNQGTVSFGVNVKF